MEKTLETCYGNVVVRSFFDCDGNTPDSQLEAYYEGGEYIGELLYCNIDDDDDTIIEVVEELIESN